MPVPAALPPFISISEPGSFARRTFERRVPAIIDGVIAGRPAGDPSAARLAGLKAEIAAGFVSDPFEAGGAAAGSAPGAFAAEEIEAWRSELAAWVGRPWLEGPFYLMEACLYLRLLLAAGWYDPGSPRRGVDPFGPAKRKELEALRGREGGADVDFRRLLLRQLWGNRMDLSNSHIAEAGRGRLLDDSSEDVIVDDSREAARRLEGARRLGIILDNAGAELAADLAMARRFLEAGPGRSVVLFCKHAPTFVSDATLADLRATLAVMAPLGPAAAGLEMNDHWFWNGPRHFTRLPPGLREELAACDLVLIKGDANYRRLIEDRRWPAGSRLVKLAAGFPAPFCVIRTLKSEALVDVAEDERARLAALDPDWLVDGRRGLIQLVDPASGK